MEKNTDRDYDSPQEVDGAFRDVALESVPKTRWERSWPVIACGAGLISDGYLNGVRFSSALVVPVLTASHE